MQEDSDATNRHPHQARQSRAVLIYSGALMVIELFNVVVPDTFNELLIVTRLFYLVVPDTLNPIYIYIYIYI